MIDDEIQQVKDRIRIHGATPQLASRLQSLVRQRSKVQSQEMAVLKAYEEKNRKPPRKMVRFDEFKCASCGTLLKAPVKRKFCPACYADDRDW